VVNIVFYLAQVATEYQVMLSSSKAPNDSPSLGRSFTTVSEEIPVMPLTLLALGSHRCPNRNAGQGFLVATCYCTEKSVLSQTLMAKKV